MEKKKEYKGGSKIFVKKSYNTDTCLKWIYGLRQRSSEFKKNYMKVSQ